MKKIMVLVVVLFAFLAIGCEYKTNRKTLTNYVNFKFDSIEWDRTDMYVPENQNKKDENKAVSYQILGTIDVTLKDDINLPFQVYEYEICNYDRCEISINDNYVYIYGKHLLEEFNKDREKELNLLIDNDTIGDKYFVMGNPKGFINCQGKEKVEDIEEELNEFKEFMNSKTKKNLSFKVNISCDNTKEFEMN